MPHKTHKTHKTHKIGVGVVRSAVHFTAVAKEHKTTFDN